MKNVSRRLCNGAASLKIKLILDNDLSIEFDSSFISVSSKGSTYLQNTRLHKRIQTPRNHPLTPLNKFELKETVSMRLGKFGAQEQNPGEPETPL